MLRIRVSLLVTDLVQLKHELAWEGLASLTRREATVVFVSSRVSLTPCCLYSMCCVDSYPLLNRGMFMLHFSLLHRWINHQLIQLWPDEQSLIVSLSSCVLGNHVYYPQALVLSVRCSAALSDEMVNTKVSDVMWLIDQLIRQKSDLVRGERVSGLKHTESFLPPKQDFNILNATVFYYFEGRLICFSFLDAEKCIQVFIWDNFDLNTFVIKTCFKFFLIFLYYFFVFSFILIFTWV